MCVCLCVACHPLGPPCKNVVIFSLQFLIVHWRLSSGNNNVDPDLDYWLLFCVCIYVSEIGTDRTNLFVCSFVLLSLFSLCLSRLLLLGFSQQSFPQSRGLFMLGFSLGVVGYPPKFLFFTAPCSGCIIEFVTYTIVVTCTCSCHFEKSPRCA